LGCSIYEQARPILEFDHDFFEPAARDESDRLAAKQVSHSRSFIVQVDHLHFFLQTADYALRLIRPTAHRKADATISPMIKMPTLYFSV
jgi:hypothetical protein